MVCVADEPRVQCIIRRLSQSAPKSKFEITLPASTSVCELFNRVANDLNYEPHSFQLRLMTQGCDKVFTESTEGTLEDVGFCTELGSRNSLLLEGADGDDRKLVVRSPPGGGEIPTHALQPPPLLPPASSPAGDYAPPVLRHDTGYVGLVNQAMTCYLNSLLQALYMTPEFRNALYKWNFELGHNKYPSKCIPFQLQKLFLNLQTSSKTAVETTKLTRSFGWESGEVWQQHDIQELCRVMFDALEQEFKETEQADLINQLYQGKMIDYVKCLECGTEKSREDTFLDIPLPVRPFGSAVAYGSIEEALGAFVQPETLDGNNQYFCENCNKKCNAHKGLKFSKFPYLLTLHLKRFDFDYSTMHRIKLNDKVVFPQELDLNSFVRCIGDEEIVEIVRSCDEVSTADSVLDEEAVATQSVENQAVDHDQEEDEGIDMSTSSGNHVERNSDEKRGPFVYELYSIMIHSGSASGGHYYAYIKDFTKSEWFCFNDQSVTRITLEDIVKTYGGGPTRGYYSGAYSSSTNAYMLMYRQIDKERNATSITHDQFPPHIMKLLKEVQESEENERIMRAREEKMMKIKVYTNPNLPCPNVQTKIYCHHDTTLAETLQKAYQDLQLENIVPIEQCRLVSYNHTQDQMEVSFEGKEKETIHNILSNLKNFSNYELFLETREKNQIFPPYSVGDIGMSIYRLEGEEVVGWYGLRSSPCQELADLRKLLQMAIPLPSTDIHIILAPPITLLCDDTRPLNKIGFSHSNRLFICPRDPAIDTNSFPSSKLYKFIEKVQNVIILHIVLPDTSADALERLLIPPLVDCKLNGNNNRHSEATPTGDKSMTLPLTNGLEEESVCGGGAGGTSDQSTSEDSSLTDSERTIIGEATSEGQLSSPSDSDQQLSSPETQLPNKIGEVNGEWEESWDDQVELNKVYYFKATPYMTQDSQKMLRVVVDRRMELNSLKGRLEKDVGVAGKYVKLFRGSDPERGDLIDSLSSLKDDDRISVKLHRVPSEGEHRVKLYVLQINSPTPVQFICDWILMRGTSVGTTKKAILKELEKRHDIKIPFDRCRLWKKNWKNQSPGKVLLDNEVWDDGDPTLACAPPKEVFVEELEGAEEATGAEDEVVLFTRRWRPSSLTLDPFKEVILTSTTVAHLKQKLSDISGIPVEHVKFAKGPSAFPCEMSVLNLHADLEWDHNVELLTDWHLNITEDGVVVFYRDDREELKELTREEQQEVRSRESVKLNGSSIIPVYSFRKEKALKIYLDLSSKSQVMEEYD